ncbi:actin-like ATPase domain-containing protein [Meira miltonrushii]|uniref:Actin-like ATPase domain-containing protein n=1 Tax=Meira miltonrushii TaxID=1280837 RepID=A0A316VC50_9BASI|nr:actin-like ATPase domain-containing protein [Meira miltonrushii]PWN35209.1 actin-like ATPase domain-containing protein [Meira miltonrushii]
MQPSRSPERSTGRIRKTSLSSSSAAIASRSPKSTSRSTHVGSTAGISSSSAALSSARRAQYGGGDDRLVLDIGARVTKIGHSNEARPRSIIWSLRNATPTERAIDSSCGGMLWSADIARCKDDTNRKVVEYKLRGRLKFLLRNLFYQILTQDPKDRKITIVHNAFMPTIVQEVLQEVLFSNLRVASVSFVPSHLMSAIAIGRSCTLVIDMGYEQASMIPIHLWRPLTHRYTLVSPKAARRVSQRLRALLLHFAAYTPPLSSNSTTGSSFSATIHSSASTPRSGQTKIPADLLDDDFLDEIKAEVLTVGPVLEHENVSKAHTTRDTQWKSRQPFSTIPEEDDLEWMEVLRKRYSGEKCTTVDISIEVPPEPSPPLTAATQPATLFYSAHPQPTHQGRGRIRIPGWVRERAIDVLFEQGDDDELSLTEMVLDALLKLPIDTRQVMANNIYLTGGTAMIPGLAHRLRLELIATLRSAEVQAIQNSISLISLDRPTNGARISKVGYVPIVSLAQHIAVVNDHAPRLDTKGRSISGKAPSFPVNLVAWTGASLINSLRIDSTTQILREEYEEIQTELTRRRKEVEGEQITFDDKRPGLGMKRASFLGSVSGLDLGTFGPLSGARNKFSAGPSGSASHPLSPTSSKGPPE